MEKDYDFARNFVFFDVDNTSSCHTDNHILDVTHLEAVRWLI